MVSPAVLLVAVLVRGVDGSRAPPSRLVARGRELLAGAFSLQWAARRGPKALAVVAVGGFIVRMAVVLGVILLAQDTVDEVWLLGVLAVTHLGLLIWEIRSSASRLRPGPEARA